MRVFLIVCCSALLSIHHSAAQSTFVGGLFPTIDHSGRITQNWDYSLYYFGAFPLVNFKHPDFSKDPNFLLFYSEQALTFNVNRQLSFSGSYVYQRENVAKENFINENRIHVQATYTHSIKKVNLKHRLRFDNRFIRNRATGDAPLTQRLRYLIGVDFPIKSKKGNLYFAAYEEAFFNTSQNASAFYAENWAYAALGVKLNDKNKIETGLLYITWNTGLNSWFNQYYLQLSWLSRLDFVKQKETR